MVLSSSSISTQYCFCCCCFWAVAKTAARTTTLEALNEEELKELEDARLNSFFYWTFPWFFSFIWLIYGAYCAFNRRQHLPCNGHGICALLLICTYAVDSVCVCVRVCVPHAIHSRISFQRASVSRRQRFISWYPAAGKFAQSFCCRCRFSCSFCSCSCSCFYSCSCCCSGSCSASHNQLLLNF